MKCLEKMNLFLCFFVLFRTIYSSSSLSCEYNKFLCADGLKCINKVDICDYTADCDDASDEMNFDLCKKLNNHRERCREDSSEKFIVQCRFSNRHYRGHSDYECLDVVAACSHPSGCLSGEDISICNDIEGNKLRNSWRPSAVNLETEKNYQELLQYIGEAFNETMKRNFSECPPFFVPFEGKCFSFFHPAKITWTEAKLFCESISGQLAVLDDINNYMDVLKFLKVNELESNFWIGGNLQAANINSTQEWIWINGKNVERGAPFWGLSFQTADTARATCDNIVPTLLPRKTINEAICIALLKKNFYYFSDENCGSKFSPLCVTNIFNN